MQRPAERGDLVSAGLLFCEFCVQTVKERQPNWQILQELPKYGIVYSKAAFPEGRGCTLPEAV